LTGDPGVVGSAAAAGFGCSAAVVASGLDRLPSQAASIKTAATTTIQQRI
jgi:hypothetical protein